MIDVLLPRTDTGVLVQALLVLPALVVALVVLRHRAEWRTLVVGVMLFAAGLFSLRAVH